MRAVATGLPGIANSIATAAADIGPWHAGACAIARVGRGAGVAVVTSNARVSYVRADAVLAGVVGARIGITRARRVVGEWRVDAVAAGACGTRRGAAGRWIRTIGAAGARRDVLEGAEIVQGWPCLGLLWGQILQRGRQIEPKTSWTTSSTSGDRPSRRKPMAATYGA